MKSGYIVYVVMALLAGMFLYAQFFDTGRKSVYSKQPITESLIIETYPELYDAIYSRKAYRLNPFLKHDSPSIRKQAWQALATTPVDSIEQYIELALKDSLDEAWFAISSHNLDTDQLRSLQTQWLEEADVRAGISRVLGQQGDGLTLNFLVDHIDQVAGSSFEYDYAQAVGRLMRDHAINSQDQQKITKQAFLTRDEKTIRAYLYGYYRGNAQELKPAVSDSLYGFWREYGLGNSTNVDQYIAGILGEDVFYEITLYQNSENELDQHIQLAVELAQSVSTLELNDRNMLAIRILLMHENPNVSQQALASLTGKLKPGGNLQRFIASEIVSDTLSDPFVWLQGLETVSKVEPALIAEYEDHLQKISERHSYFLPQVLRIRQMSDIPKAYVDRIASIIENGDMLRSMYAVSAMSQFWNELPEEQKTDDLIENTREVLFKALQLQDRGVAYAIGSLLEDDTLISKTDFEHINRALSAFNLPEDIEVYQTFGTLYKEKFEEQAQPVIDSLATFGYAPLNRHLRDAGWDVTVPEASGTTFRTPSWERLWEMGREPVWVLETDKGMIKVRMNTLSAPATISAIDSLTLAGTYDGVPFHRVVPNFVIQGGDIERQDGFGGPDFIIPTEASETEFARGAAGIASAGTDTEGSQYFFMHQWKPHLNGNYTLFGNVIEGMDVIDQIVPGDKVTRAYWQ